MKFIPYAHQFIDKADIKQVIRVLKSDYLTQGPEVRNFEQALCKYTGAKYAVAVSSGTAALHLAVLSLNIKQGNEILTSPITFSASANCALYVGARPLFIDIDDKTYHLDIDKLEDYLKMPSKRRLVKVVIPIHFMGTVIDTVRIHKICARYGIKIIEDAAHALGAKYKYKDSWLPVGCCKHSDIAIFSFHPIKHITTGEGGMILTNDKNIYERALRLRHHGIVKNKKRPFLGYDIAQIGFNYRITDFQSALGISQLKKINRVVKERRGMVKTYNDHFSQLEEIRLPYERPDAYASYHLYVIRAQANKRNRLSDYLRNNAILTQINYVPVHLLSYYRKRFGFKQGDFPVAERYFSECLSLPLYFGLSKKEQKYVIKKVCRFFEK